jgi:hypothetical protein
LPDIEQVLRVSLQRGGGRSFTTVPKSDDNDFLEKQVRRAASRTTRILPSNFRGIYSLDAQLGTMSRTLKLLTCDWETYNLAETDADYF